MIELYRNEYLVDPYHGDTVERYVLGHAHARIWKIPIPIGLALMLINTWYGLQRLKSWHF
jgi:hypothetical protein